MPTEPDASQPDRLSRRRLTEGDLGMLAEWLARPHVHRWWHHESSASAVLKEFGPAARGEVAAEDLLVSLDDAPFALVQRSRLGDYPDYLAELRRAVDVPSDAVTIDYFIADPAHTGRGLGTTLIRHVVEWTWEDHPQTSAVVVAVAAGNPASWRALEKAGLTRVAEGDVTPDNPADPPLHYIYRVERPS